MERHALFGNSVEIDLPSNLVDISNFRQIPDHQEVYADGNTDTSFIFEILEKQEHLSGEEALPFYWNDLVEANEAVSSSIEITQVLDPESVTITRGQTDAFLGLVTGEQHVAKGKDSVESANLVQVDLGLVRLPSVRSDVILSLNTVLVASEESSSSVVIDMRESLQGRKERASMVFKSILDSVIVKDWSLFG